MSVAQASAVGRVLASLRPEQAHHGDCVGADAQFHRLCLQLGVDVNVHPPSDPKLRAGCGPSASVEVHAPRPYLERNRDIVDASDVLTSAPAGAEVVRSGTWATVRYARKRSRRILIVWSDGTVKEDVCMK